jgi:hypothetical protein
VATSDSAKNDFNRAALQSASTSHSNLLLNALSIAPVIACVSLAPNMISLEADPDVIEEPQDVLQPYTPDLVANADTLQGDFYEA